jgi:pyruvate formate lyase activating enzyme
MTINLFTTAGCIRCKIAKQYLSNRQIPYTETDIKGEGKPAFQRFYQSHRASIYRGEEGVYFPILFDEGRNVVRQGLGQAAAYARGKGALEGFFGCGHQDRGWVEDFFVSEGDADRAEMAMEVLDFLKKTGMNTAIVTDGRNAGLLERLVTADLCDLVIMEVRGPESLYPQILGTPVNGAEIRRSISWTARAPEHRFETAAGSVVPRTGGAGGHRDLTPPEAAEAAALIREVTGDHKQPYRLRLYRPEDRPGVGTAVPKTLTRNELFPYRTAARKHLVYTEIEKV